MLFTTYINSLANHYHCKQTVKLQIQKLTTISRHEEVPLFLFSLPLERLNTFLWLPWKNRFCFGITALPFPNITFSYQGNFVTNKINIYERKIEHYYKAIKTVKFTVRSLTTSAKTKTDTKTQIPFINQYQLHKNGIFPPQYNNTLYYNIPTCITTNKASWLCGSIGTSKLSQCINLQVIRQYNHCLLYDIQVWILTFSNDSHTITHTTWKTIS